MIRALSRRGATSRAVARRGVAASERDAAAHEGFSAMKARCPVVVRAPDASLATRRRTRDAGGEGRGAVTHLRR